MSRAAIIRHARLRTVLLAAAAVLCATALSAQTASAGPKPRPTPAPTPTATSSSTAPPAGSLAPVTIRGADISFTLQEEKAGKAVLGANGKATPIETVLAQKGANYVRLRVWVNPPAGYSTEASALVLAKRAKAAGLRILLDLHYSDFWADPNYQATPAAWAGQTLPQLSATVQAYTAKVVGDFAAQGTPAHMIQIGNEIGNGMLWPIGKVRQADGEHWAELAALLNAGIAGAHAAQAQLPIVIHVESGSDYPRTRYFLDRIMANGVTGFDVIGLSYYAFWQSGLPALSASLNSLATALGKPLLIAETSYPWTLAGTTGRSWVSTGSQLPEAAAYPATPQGQAAYFAALRKVIAAVPNGLGLGILDWEPGWMAGVTDQPTNGTTQANLTMFDAKGAPLPSLVTAFRAS